MFLMLPLGLESADYIVVSIIEKYLDFKTLEVWQEVRGELEMEITHGQKFLDEIVFILQNKALAVSVVQKALIQTNFEQGVKICQFQCLASDLSKIAFVIFRSIIFISNDFPILRIALICYPTS